MIVSPSLWAGAVVPTGRLEVQRVEERSPGGPRLSTALVTNMVPGSAPGSWPCQRQTPWATVDQAGEPMGQGKLHVAALGLVKSNLRGRRSFKMQSSHP